MVITSRSVALGCGFLALALLVQPEPALSQATSETSDVAPPLPSPRPDDAPDASEVESDSSKSDSGEEAQDTETDDESSEATPPVPQDRPSGNRDGENSSESEDERSDDAASERNPDSDARQSEDVDLDEFENQGPLSQPRADQPTLPLSPSDEKIAACEKALDLLKVSYEVLEPIAGDNECGVARPYNVTEINGVEVNPSTSITCDAALAMARWVRSVVQPSAAAFGPDVRVSAINHGSTYICRRRNNKPTGKLSEHAKGKAIDVMSFSFEGHKPLPIVPRAGKGTMEEAFQRTVQAGACLQFTTVLGPGSDEYHNDHLHLDVIERSSGYRLCQ
ncbi:extensin family protein [Notoacmeibacter ruber]|nr:extensin family protein [Notoacmeibacter ruber]